MIPRTLEDIFVQLVQRLAEIERRFENRERTGTVAEIDIEKGVARVKLETGPDGKPFLTPWIPWEEPALGNIKTHMPPAVGEQVKVVSESGDLTDAYIRAGALPSKSNKRCHDKPGEMAIDMHDGKYRMVIDKDGNQTESHNGQYTVTAKNDIAVAGATVYIN